MQNIWLVLKNTIITTMARRSFILTLILVPLLPFLVMLGVSSMGGDTNSMPSISEMLGNDTGPEILGVVDRSGIVQQVPEGISESLILFPDEAAAEKAMLADEIQSYAVIAQDYIETGKVISIRPDFNPIAGFEQSASLSDLLDYNLLNHDQALFDKVRAPMDLEVQYLAPEPQRDPGSMLTFFIPYIVTFLFYMVILFSASLMLSSVTDEKENRVIEILMTSITPSQMLTGKMIGLGLAGLLQTVVWGAAGLGMLRFSKTSFDISEAFQLPISVLLWGILFFIFGYAVYASLMAGIGALVPNLREASQATTLVIMPLIVPLMLITLLIQKPNHILSVILSIFPLTSPVAMMTRLSATTQVPFWQPLLAILLLIGTTVLVVRASAGMFRAQNLLSGQPFKVKYFFRALFGKA